MEPHLNKKMEAGLSEAVHACAVKLLQELVPMWLAEEALDWKRVVSPQGAGSFAVNIEPYSGPRTWIAFRDKLEGHDSLKQLELAIQQHQPELLGYVALPGHVLKIPDAASLAACWCQGAKKYTEQQVSINESIERILNDLHGVLVSRRLIQQVRSPLGGLILPEGVERIDLTNSVLIRKLSVEEISDLGSHDITFGRNHDIVSNPVSTAVFINKEVDLQLTTHCTESSLQADYQQRTQEQLGVLLSALHILKDGCVGVIASFFDIGPLVLPNLAGHSSAPLVRRPFVSMQMTNADIQRLLDVHARLVANQRDEVRIASARLMDAEHRMSPVDALLDAVIGLEALLNPNDYSELSFRVALNYAFLGPAANRRVRFERVREIQKVRNRVVHGGLNLQSKEASLIHENAIIAKSCLRDAILSFLFDSSLAGNRKLDVDFWLDRVLPPTDS